MVDSSVIAGGAVIFFVLLAIIIYGSRGAETTAKPKRERKPKGEKVKQDKPKKKVTALKKSERPAPEAPKRYPFVDRNQDARELEEFLKGKDKAEILKALTAEEKKAKRASKKSGEEEQPREEYRGQQINEKEASTFEPVKQKAKKEKKAKPVVEESTEPEVDAEGNPIEKKQGKKKGKKTNKYFKSEEAAEKKAFDERQAAREAREAEKADRKRREEAGEVVERKPRRERKEGEEDRPRRYRQAEDGNEAPEGERRTRVVNIPTFEDVERQVKYEAADIGDLLNMFGQPAKSSGAQASKDQ